jgi:hypothetical protein
VTKKPAAILFVLSLAVLALALVPAAGLAAKGGNGTQGGGGGGKPPGGGSTPSATVTASPNPADAYGALVELTGCGYDMYQPAELNVVHSAGYTEAYMVTVWSPGCLHPTSIATAEPGTYTINMYQFGKRGKVLVASTTLTVV